MSRTALGRAAVIPVVVLLMAGVSCRRGAAPPAKPAPAVAESEPVVRPVSNLLPRVVGHVQPRESATAIFSAYRGAIHDADFGKAAELLERLETLLQRSTDAGVFWAKVLAPEDGVTLNVFQFCSHCVDGRCAACRGSGKCPDCRGERVCFKCGGKPLPLRVCRGCLCPDCRATGRCQVCKGYKGFECKVCGSAGRVLKPAREACETCKGRGYREGLTRAKGTPAKLVCMTCGGSGKRSDAVWVPCVNCGGKGRVPCKTCAGTGNCPTCKGATRVAGCRICSGGGYYSETCSECSGSMRCGRCRGTGRCVVCWGGKVCPHCSGAAVVLAQRFPVGEYWRPRARNLVLVHADRPRGSGEPVSKAIRFGDRTVQVELAPGDMGVILVGSGASR